ADFRDGNGVRYIGFAAGPELPQVSLVGKTIGFLDALDVFGVEVQADDLGKRRQRGNGVRWRFGAWYQGRRLCGLAPAQPRAFLENRQEAGRSTAKTGKRHMPPREIRLGLCAAFPGR